VAKSKAKSKTKSKTAKKAKDAAKAISVSALKRAIEGRNSHALSGFYGNDAVLHIVDRDNPPSKPKSIVGKKAIGAFHDDVCGRNMSHKLLNGIADDKHIAFTQSCLYPDGTKVLCSTMIELKAGKITRQTVVQAWDG
jgi:hypothetical protein